MKIKRSVLEQLVREELANHIRGLMEADVDLADAHNDKKDKEAKPEDDKAEKKPADKKAAPPAKDGEDKGEPKELPTPEEPADKDLDKDVAEPDEEEDAEDVTGGKIADELTGKTIQSLTMEPKSKILPGAQEIVVTFNQIPDPLRILITKTGQVKFYFKGLHNEL